jgi:hypothetical protein
MTYNNELLHARLIEFLKSIDENGPKDAKYVTDSIRAAILELSICDGLERAVTLSRELQKSARTIEAFATSLVRESKLFSYTIHLERVREVTETITVVVYANSEKEAREEAEKVSREEDGWREYNSECNGPQIEGITRIPKP